VTNSPSCRANSIDEGAEVDVIDMGIVDLDLPSWRRFLLMAGRTFSANSRGTLTRTVSPLASEPDDADMQPAVLGYGCCD